ncbi:bifunctional enoyl-CoA hydratase/phosphate acetyltransferase [Breoghania sp.]|uniref:bifunctional enoyl-CoA hydratase/phosphate acetyltransferase n=1 Tax=Breoghania sp. TaxID=2065378 RepID=UPI002AA87A76|nr:bifunctional enoyl-CoA hydratase/phosphate acetyltransferase [Breoghania sp.]
MVANKTYDEINVGDSASITRVCTANDLYIFANASGNLNPLNLPDFDHNGDGRKNKALAPAMWVGALVSAVLGNVLPGPGTIYRSQSFRFLERVHVGETLTVTVTILAKEPDNLLRVGARVEDAGGRLVADGEGMVEAPARKIILDDHEVPQILVERHHHFNRLIARAQTLEPLATAVVWPDEASSLNGAILAAQAGLMQPILIGLRGAMEAVAEKIGQSLDGCQIVEADSDVEAAKTAVSLVHAGRAAAIMKGHLHTDTLLKPIIARDHGLRDTRRITHAFIMDVPGRPAPLIISDAAINIAPNLSTKVDITQNAIDMARSMGVETPKVGVLSAVETVNPSIPSTLDAAILSKMAERGQIRGGIVDGPLAMDNAVDVNAARTKGITSLVAGHADVLIMPNMEAGNMLAKELTFIAHAQAAGVVLGARVPVILTSRADDDRSRLASCALALLFAHWQKTGVAAVSPAEEEPEALTGAPRRFDTPEPV